MKLPFYQIDAFTSSVFSGNPAGVCLLDAWLDDSTLQAIAAENNLSETAFLVRSQAGYKLRWFTPTIEVDLCGHATLASAFVVFAYLDTGDDAVRFETVSGVLTVRHEGDLLVMDFPSRRAVPCPVPDELIRGLGIEPREVLLARDLLAVYDSEAQIRSLQPDMLELSKLDCLGIIVTAPGSECDFVSRFFAPREGIPEDPVTGSSHCTLIPYWAERTGKSKLHARQLSERGGELFCIDLNDRDLNDRDRSDRVSIAGRAVTYLEGTIIV